MLECFFRLTRGMPAVMVQSEALWARIPEIQVRIPSRAMGTFFPHTVSSIFRLSLTRLVRLSGGPCRCLASRSRRRELECFMHDCFTIELTGECLECFFRLTRGVPAVVVQSETLWARIPEIQVRIPSRAMGSFSPHTVSSIFRLSLIHTHTRSRAPDKSACGGGAPQASYVKRRPSPAKKVKAS